MGSTAYSWMPLCKLWYPAPMCAHTSPLSSPSTPQDNTHQTLWQGASSEDMLLHKSSAISSTSQNRALRCAVGKAVCSLLMTAVDLKWGTAGGTVVLNFQNLCPKTCLLKPCLHHPLGASTSIKTRPQERNSRLLFLTTAFTITTMIQRLSGKFSSQKFCLSP